VILAYTAEFEKRQFKIHMLILRYVAKISHKRYGICKAAAFFDTFENALIIQIMQNTKRIMITTANVHFLSVKKTGDHKKFKRSWM
jgi:hypothetical protein